MFIRYLLLINYILLTLNQALAQDCPTDINHALPNIELPQINIEVNPNSYFCFDKNETSNKELLEKYQSLKSKKVFDESDCLIEAKYDYETNNKITEFILATIKSKLKIYSSNSNNLSSNSPLLMTNSDNTQFANSVFGNYQKDLAQSNKLDKKDQEQIIASVVTASLVGIAVERSVFRDKNGNLEKDKVLHSNYGVLVNLGSVAAANLAIETFGLGNRLNLTKKQKKWTILLSGSVVGLLVGYGKERFYDFYHKDKHTFDPNLNGDTGATWLGGGAFNALSGAIIFNF